MVERGTADRRVLTSDTIRNFLVVTRAQLVAIVLSYGYPNRYRRDDQANNPDYDIDYLIILHKAVPPLPKIWRPRPPCRNDMKPTTAYRFSSSAVYEYKRGANEKQMAGK